MTEYMQELLGDRQEFTIDNDNIADWAVSKVMEAVAERDRLIAIADAKIKELQDQKRAIAEKTDNATNYLTGKLFDYFQAVKPSTATKTQTTYKLLSGALVLKKQQPEFVRDDNAMIEWAKASAPSYIKVKESVDWAELKKQTMLDGETVVYSETGEVIPGIVAKARDDVFEVKHG